MLVAVVLGHVVLSVSIDELPLGEVLRGTPAWIGDVLSGELGETPGGFCLQIGPFGNPRAAVRVLHGLGRERHAAHASRGRRPAPPWPVIGITFGVAVGRYCATHPAQW